MLNHNADSYYDTAYGKITVDEDKRPEEAVLEAIKKATIEKAVAEAFEGKTEVVDDVVVDGEKYTLYEQSVTKEFAEAMKTLKKSVFEGLVSDLGTYKVTKSPYSSTNDFSKWAFEAGRTVGEIKNCTSVNDVLSRGQIPHVGKLTYCDHCDALYGEVAEKYGVELKFAPEYNEYGSCKGNCTWYAKKVEE